MNLQSQCRNPEDAVRRHRWRMHMHIDGCHSFGSTYTCADNGCTATLHTHTERSPAADPWSMVWMEPAVVEVTRDPKTGRFVKPYFEEQKCERCEELIAGAEPVHLMSLVP